MAYYRMGPTEHEADFPPTQTMLVSSADLASWSSPQLLELGPLNGFSPYGKMVAHEDGTLLLPVYGPDEQGNDASFLLRSYDGGRTFVEPSLVAPGFNESAFAWSGTPRVLVGALRSVGEEPSVHVVKSNDGGRTFSEPFQVTRRMEHPADLLPLSCGWLLLVYGQRNPPFGVRAMVSIDQGANWDRFRELVIADDCPSEDCGYPSAIRLANGRILVAFYAAEEPWLDQSGPTPGVSAYVASFDEKELLASYM